nr:hypothetical protein BaRGS_013264 [Batillaria attramentaria]
MDEGRLGLVLRQEEQHRKFVYMMNDIVRSQLGMYTNCLARERHEASMKLINSCVEVRRSIVRQNVLKKCLEMRKRKVLARDTTAQFGQYGGKPLWAMSRDIERVIADNHPRIRRIKRAQEMMRHSLESGAILDEDAVTRRMEAFFQVRQGRQHHQKKSVTGENSADYFRRSQSPRKAYKLPPIVATPADKSTSLPGPRRDPQLQRRKGAGGSVNPTGDPSLAVDEKGRLVGIRTSQAHEAAADSPDEKHEHEQAKKKPTGTGEGTDNQTAETSALVVAGKATDTADKSEVTNSGRDGEFAAAQDTDGGSGRDEVKTENVSENDNDENRDQKRRSTLILPPIETSKALVSRT